MLYEINLPFPIRQHLLQRICDSLEISCDRDGYVTITPAPGTKFVVRLAGQQLGFDTWPDTNAISVLNQLLTRYEVADTVEALRLCGHHVVERSEGSRPILTVRMDGARIFGHEMLHWLSGVQDDLNEAFFDLECGADSAPVRVLGYSGQLIRAGITPNWKGIGITPSLRPAAVEYWRKRYPQWKAKLDTLYETVGDDSDWVVTHSRLTDILVEADLAQCAGCFDSINFDSIKPEPESELFQPARAVSEKAALFVSCREWFEPVSRTMRSAGYMERAIVKLCRHTRPMFDALMDAYVDYQHENGYSGLTPITPAQIRAFLRK